MKKNIIGPICTGISILSVITKFSDESLHTKDILIEEKNNENNNFFNSEEIRRESI
ncbi:MAG: hypothetical protein HRS57_00255 [Mycoplasmataceae bacterium]|nr:hypothetical protein [Mycoplasmataceae bacterium]